VTLEKQSPAEQVAPSPPRCAWCGASLGPGSERLRGRTRCRACGAATTDPWPSGDELERAYRDWYRPASGRFSGGGDAVLKSTRGLLDRIAPDGPVLDVGSGEGALLDALAARGREATGLERASQRPDVRSTDIGEVDGQWAAVVFWHSLEHLRAPGAAIEHAARLLTAGGVLVIAGPNAASLQARAFGDRWFALDLPRHLVHLPAAAVLSRLREQGLEPYRVSYLLGGQVVFGWLHGLVGSLPGNPDLYDAIRLPGARRRRLSAGARLVILGAALLLLPVAGLCAGIEAALRRGGTVYVEARNG
jgi:SAM-dependent methyltransferase